MKLLRTLVAGSIALAACSEAPVYTVAPNVTPTETVLADGSGRYIVVFRSQNSVPKTFEAEVAAAGGTIEMAMPKIGAAVVSNLNAAGAAMLAGSSSVQSVDADQQVSMNTNGTAVDVGAASLADAEIASPTNPQLAGFYALQWN